ncbi:hypothetical protein Hsar01_03225 [Haloferula sargassicola]|uniref:Uncharacterized protein n=1 Tax=Haloferula sargassicola TaxID=490096 RepID=A0ABP9UR15_9BACT
MDLVYLKQEAARLFPLAAAHALAHGPEGNRPLESLNSLCREHFEALGFRCMADCLDAVVPRVRGRLTLEAWSSAELTVSPWTFRVECRAFWLGSTQVHLTVRHDGPLPGITETGYRSIFAPVGMFADGTTPEGFIRGMFPQTAQMSLF